MMEPMHPTSGDDRMTTATNGRATAATGRPPGEEDPNSHTDELIIALEKVPLLRDNQNRIEENFHVIVGLGMCAKEDIEMQWITIQGLVEDRVQAKSYIKALCSPGKDMEFNFPDELHQTLSHPNVLDRLEKQSNTAILFLSCGHAVIQGEDDLAVALAMSAIEEIIQKYVDVNISDVSSPNSSLGELSDRLDREIRRLSSQNKELYADDYDMDNLTSLPGPVKRTLLKQYIDDSRQSNGGAQSKCDGAATCPQDPDETIPMRLAGSKSASKIPSQQFVDLHPATVVKPALINETWVTVDHPAKSTSLQTEISLSLNLDYDSDNSFVDLSESVSKTARGTKWENSLVVDTTPTPIAAPVVDLRVPGFAPAVTDEQPILAGEAIRFALKSGYRREEIDEVCSAYGDILSTAEFIQVLHTNRCEKANERAVTVSELEAKHLPRPAQDRIPEFLVLDDVGTNSSQDEEPVEPERPITPSSKQQSNKTHMQGPKMKKGKLSKKPSKHVGKKTQGRRNRRSPSEENTEKMEVVSLLDGPGTSAANTILPNEVRDVLQDGLQQNMKRKSGREEDDKNNNVLMEYLSLLTQDYNEENSNDIEEVRKRNFVRRRILEKFLELKGSQEPKSTDIKGGKLEETDVAALGGESWNTVSVDGRHRFGKVAGSPVKDNELEAVGGASGGAGTKPKQPDASASNTKPKPHDWSDQSHFHTKEKPAAGGSLDTLDDFSILSNFNDVDDFDLHFLAQHGVRTSNAKTQHKAARPVKSVNTRNPTHVQMQTPQLYNYQPQPVHQAPQPLMSKQIQRPPPPAPVYTSNSGSNSSAKPNLRYIVIDGSNVAMTHGNHEIFSCKGIKLCIDYFRRRGHTEVTAFVPQWRTNAPRPGYPIRDQHLLEELRKDSVLVFTPARRVPGKNIVCYDDKFVLRLAQETEGVIVSNDNYRDLWHEKREWRQIIEERLLMFSFVGDIFMAPDDPLGRDGPHLDEFLRKYSIFPDQYIRDQQQQNRSQHENGLRPYNRHNQGQGSRAAPLQNKFHGRQIQAQGARNTANHFDYNRVYSGARENSQLQDHFLHGQGQGKFPHNPHGQSPGKFLPVAQGQGQGQGQRQFGQGAAAVGLRQRPLAETEALKQKLSVIFTDQEVKIDEVLLHNPIETNINKIIEFMLEVD